MAGSSDTSGESFLRLEFTKIIKKLDGDERWTDSLLQTYMEEQRHYHTILHIYSMLICLEKNKNLIKDQTAVQLAIFFHDWVYDPKAHDNEVQSVKVFQAFADELNLGEPLRSHVSHYIEATITHSLTAEDEDDQDLRFFLDFDLEVLGRSPSDYALYASQIRQEYGHFADAEYASGRVGVLESFWGARDYSFRTAFTRLMRRERGRIWKER